MTDRATAYALLVLLAALPSTAHSQDLYSPATVREFRLYFEQPNWREQLQQNVKTERDIPARLTVDGLSLDSAGVRYKGNSSFNIPGDKKPFNITTDAFIKGQKLWGYGTLNLNNCFKDPTFVREMIAYRLAAMYMPSAKASYVRLFINDEYWGLYLHVQQVNRTFLREWFGDDSGNHYKCDPRGDLTWLGADTAKYRANYELKTNLEAGDYSDLVEFIRLLNQLPPDRFADGIRPVLDVDRALWYLAFCNLLVNLDSYIGSGHNYYLYNNPRDGRFAAIPWDLNEVLGTFAMQLSLSDRERLPVYWNQQAPNRPLLSRLLAVPEFRARYTAHFRTMFREVFTRDYWVPLVQLYQNLIRQSVLADSKKLYPMQMFDENVASNVHAGPGGPGATVIPGILSLIDSRRAYLASLPELNSVQAIIAKPEIDPMLPRHDLPVNVAVQATDAAHAILWWSAGGKAFERIPMRKSGDMHAAEIPPQEGGTLVRYYIEAVTRDGVASFSPERAEHETWSYAVSPRPSGVPVVINEVMAWNTSTITDPQGHYDDWIELYNTSDDSFDLSGCWLSDRPTNLRKWKFPDGTVIRRKEYLIVWADNDTADSPGLHAGFRIDRSNEGVYFTDSDARGNAMIDSSGMVAYRKDTSRARLPNGTGPFTHRSPTPGWNNDQQTDASPLPERSVYSLSLFPNPAAGAVFINTELPHTELAVLVVSDVLGRAVLSINIEGGTNIRAFDISTLPAGIHLARLVTPNGRTAARAVLYTR